MKRVCSIAREEWRYWLRSRLALAGMILMTILLVVTGALNVLQMNAEREARLQHQAQAEQAFLSQPDRHPHRMVHYGHYVFRTPAPLAIFERGLDPVTGQSIFLEGHRQNTAMFADAGASANLGGLPNLTPAWVYQVFVPLLIILLGHASIVRERELGTLAPMLAQGVSGGQIFAGKALALCAVVGISLVPLIVVGGVALGRGETVLAVLLMVSLYALYLLFWTGLTLLASALLSKRSLVIGSLVSVWLLVVLILPGLSVNIAAERVPAAGKIETDLAMYADQRDLSDGHSANDPVFAQLLDELLEQHGVERIEDLPVNFRGIVSEYAEAKLTDVLNEYAERRMSREAEQAANVRRFGWLSPTISVSFASRALAGTDLENHHRFLREAETLRYDFVQALNRVHAHQMAYEDDIKRSVDSQAEQRTRVTADNWALLDSFRFSTEPVSTRANRALAPAFALLLWLGLVLAAGCVAARRITL